MTNATRLICVGLLTRISWRSLAFAALLVGCSSTQDSTHRAGTLADAGKFDAAPATTANTHEASVPETGADARGDCSPRMDVHEVLDDYLAAWNEPDATKRDCLLARSMVADAIYVDPATDTRDRAALSDKIGVVPRGTNPVTRWTSDPELRKGDLRRSWSFLTQLGLDYMELAADGRIAAVHGFWDPFNGGDPIAAVTAYVDAWNAADATARTDRLTVGVSDSVRFRDPTHDASGSQALADAINATRTSGLTTVTSVKLQSYGSPLTHARLALELVDAVGAKTTVTDYLRFDSNGRILRIGRFADTP
jgi:hypothetical protein